MPTHSRSCITNSPPQADLIVDQLRAAHFSEEEISVLPLDGSSPDDSTREDRTDDPPGGAFDSSILISVHLEDGGGLSRAEEIFGRAGATPPPLGKVEDERPISWLKPVLPEGRG